MKLYNSNKSELFCIFVQNILCSVRTHRAKMPFKSMLFYNFASGISKFLHRVLRISSMSYSAALEKTKKTTPWNTLAMYNVSKEAALFSDEPTRWDRCWASVRQALLECLMAMYRLWFSLYSQIRKWLPGAILAASARSHQLHRGPSTWHRTNLYCCLHIGILLHGRTSFVFHSFPIPYTILQCFIQ